MLPRFGLFAAAALFAGTVAAPPLRAGLGEPSSVAWAPSSGAATLVEHGAAAPLVVSPNDWPGVLRAAHDVQADVGRVTQVRPGLRGNPPAQAETLVVAGTIGRSYAVDALVRSGKLDVSGVQGQWEAWVTQVVDHPFPGVGRALVIAGSDQRGTIYGLYDLSEQIGVSPWYWWADVPPERHDALYFMPGRTVHPSPAVRYRGIFLNDEAPDLTNWVRHTYGYAPVRSHPPVPPGVANYGHAFYARIFELLLRLRGNCLWPAMWNNAFYEDDPLDGPLADEYGIVMGTSHQEPMLRAQKEWDRRYLRTVGPWNYAREPDLLQSFWAEGVRRSRQWESLVTIGLRGENDTAMAPGGPAANEALLEKVVAEQRRMLADSPSPQIWCLYKEVQNYYDAGMRVPDDVTLLWADDNWGDLRRVPTPAERGRSGGAGIYYHFDYHGGPRSYQWLNTNPLPKIWDQMSVARQYGANRLWIVNVGHFKGYELPMEFFLRLAWNPGAWPARRVGDFTRLWAAREFGAAHAREIAAVLDGYAKYNGRRKPELLTPATYSLVHYREWERVVAQFDALAAQARRIEGELPADEHDAYEELVRFPTEASACVNRVYFDAARNRLCAQQGRASANRWAAAVRTDFARYLHLVDYFNHGLAHGKWDHFMDEPVFGYTSWRDPSKNSLRAVPLATVHPPAGAAMGVMVQGSAAAYASGEGAGLSFDSIARQTRYVEVFRTGAGTFAFTVTPRAPWLRASAPRGTCGDDQRVEVTVNWGSAPIGRTSTEIDVSGAGHVVRVPVSVFKPEEPTRRSLRGFAESDGYVSIDPEHFEANVAAGPYHWSLLPDYGRTSSGMRADAPADAPPAQPGQGSARLVYRVYLFDTGQAAVTTITSPILDFIPGRPVRYALAFDDEPPQIVTLVSNPEEHWAQAVTDNARYGHSTHPIARPGYHTLTFWMIDPDVVLQKILINLGGLRSSYLGPPESFRGPAGGPPPAQR